MKDLSQNPRRIYLIDDHSIVRHGLATVINQQPDLSVCGESADARAALDSFSTLQPDLVILDLSLKSCDGIDVIKTVRDRFPGIAVLVLTMHDASFYAERALRAGAKGYLSKRDAAECVITAIHDLLEGEMYVSEDLSPKLLKRLLAQSPERENLVGRLSQREQQVFVMLGQGLGTTEIARELDLSPKTIETYRGHIKTKLELGDSRELTRYAIRWVLRNNDA